MNNLNYNQLKLTIAEANNLPAGVDLGISEVLIACGTRVWVCMGAHIGMPKHIFIMAAQGEGADCVWNLEKKTVDDQSVAVRELLANLLLKK